MRKKLVISILFFVFVMLSYSVMFIISPSNANADIVLSEISVNLVKPLTLNFNDSRLRVISWDKNYVEISGTPLFKKLNQDNCDIKYENDIIYLENYSHRNIATNDLLPWLPILQFNEYRNDSTLLSDGVVEFIIYVPKDIELIINAKSIYNFKDINIISFNDELIN